MTHWCTCGHRSTWHGDDGCEVDGCDCLKLSPKPFVADRDYNEPHFNVRSRYSH